MKNVTCLLLLTIFALSVSGCGAKGSAAAGQRSTPKAALLEFTDALAVCDEERAFACLAVSDREAATIRAAIGLNRIIMAFRDKFLAAYGQAAWDTFQSPVSSGTKFTIPEKIPPKDITVSETGDRAVASVKGEPNDIILIRRDGDWYVTFEGLIPPEDQLDALDRSMGAMADTLSDYTPKVGQPGVTPEQLDREIAAEALKALSPDN